MLSAAAGTLLLFAFPGLMWIHILFIVPALTLIAILVTIALVIDAYRRNGVSSREALMKDWRASRSEARSKSRLAVKGEERD
jgi:hypothetical protein